MMIAAVSEPVRASVQAPVEEQIGIEADYHFVETKCDVQVSVELLLFCSYWRFCLILKCFYWKNVRIQEK